MRPCARLRGAAMVVPRIATGHPRTGLVASNNAHSIAEGGWSCKILRDAVRRIEKDGAEAELAKIRRKIDTVGRLHEDEAQSLRKRVQKVRIKA